MRGMVKHTAHDHIIGLVATLRIHIPALDAAL
jgi:hypothetical protein